MARLPLELLDEIVSLAIAVGILSVNDASRICYHWTLIYQKLLFKSVRVDPFSDNILDLTNPFHTHLVPYIKEVRVVHRSDFPTPLDHPDYNRDLTKAFTSFLRNARSVVSMIFLDARIQWGKVSPETIGAFRAVFERPSFRSLEISVSKPLPPWMLLYGGCVASDLTVHCIGPFEPPLLTVEPVKYQCSLTRLVLFGNSSVREISQFCMLQRGLADDLLRNVVDLVVECTETPAWCGPPITPHVELMVAYLAPRLQALDLRVGSSVIPTSYISPTAVHGFKSLQRLSIYLAGPSWCHLADTLVSATQYVQSFLSCLPSPSPIKSLSFRTDDRRMLDSRANNYTGSYRSLLAHLYKLLSCPEKWPCLTSTNVLINVNDNNLTGTLCKRHNKKVQRMDLEINSLLQVNMLKANEFGGSLIPQMG